MPIVTNCPTCQSRFQLPDNLAGQQVQCQNCTAVFVAPQVNAAAPGPSPLQPISPESDSSFTSVFDSVSAPTTGGYGGHQPSAPQPSYGHSDPYSEDSSRMGLWIGLGVGGFLAILALGGLTWFLLAGDDDTEVADNSSPTSGEVSNSNNSLFSSDRKTPDPSKADKSAKELLKKNKELAEAERELEKLKKAEAAKRDAARAEEKRQREEERRLRDEKWKKDAADRKADRAGIQREGETFEGWVTRSCQRTDYGSDKFFVVLERMDVVPEQLDFVSGALCDYVGENGPKNFEEVAAAMFKWRTPATDQAIMDCVGNRNFGSTARRTLMQSLSKIGTAEAAEKLAVALDGHYHEAKPYLIQMGSVAEPAVLPYLEHENSFVRRATYEVLADIGTRASLKNLSSNLKRESSSKKAVCQAAIDEIKTRHPPEEGEGAEDAENQ